MLSVAQLYRVIEAVILRLVSAIVNQPAIRDAVFALG